jgi:hypothetical protein
MCIPLDAVIRFVKLDERTDGSITWVAPDLVNGLCCASVTPGPGRKHCPPRPKAKDPECDKLDKRGIRAHFDHVMKRMIKLAGPAAGKSISYLLCR